MRKAVPSKSSTAGLPPGTLVHLGEQKTETPTISVWQYDERDLREVELTSLEECVRTADPATVTWINVAGIHQVELLQKIGDCFGLHALVLEDILDTAQRPKLEDYADYVFVVLKSLYREEATNQAAAEQVSLILGATYVISFEERESALFEPVRERIRNGKGRISRAGADYLAYALLDAVVDNYFEVIEKLGDKLNEVEEAVVESPTTSTARAVNEAKREIIFLRKAVWPLREVIGGLQRTDTALVKDSTGTYLRDVYDHTIEIMDTIETYRDMLSGMLDIYLSSLSNRLNEVMKVLTIIATIFIPLTFIAGVYGMNFHYMPELTWRWAYPLLWVLMVTVAGGMLLYFHKRKWL